MNSRWLCRNALLVAVATFALQGCDSDNDDTPAVVAVAPIATPSPSGGGSGGTAPEIDHIDVARQMINLPAYPTGTNVQISMVLRNLPDMEVPELGPTTRAALYDCVQGSCSIDRNPNYLSTIYNYEFDGTFLAATTVGGGTYQLPGSSGAFGGGISWATVFGGGRTGETLGIAYGTQNTRLYATNYSTGMHRHGSLEGSWGHWADVYLRAWPERAWKNEPLKSLRHALNNDVSSEVHALYFSPALFPLEFLPGLTCQTATVDLDEALVDCIGAAFGQNTEPMYRAPTRSSTTPGTDAPEEVPAAAYGNEFDWLSDVYDLMVNTANDNVIFVVPAGDHGGELTADPYYYWRGWLAGFTGGLSLSSTRGSPYEFNLEEWARALASFREFSLDDEEFLEFIDQITAIADEVQPPADGYPITFAEDLHRKLNELFFASGRQAPTNIWAWVPAVAANPTNVLPVVAVDPQGGIADASSQCGEALADYCVAAPGFYFSVTVNRVDGVRASRGQPDENNVSYRLISDGERLGRWCPGSGEEGSGTAICYTSQTGPRLMWVLGSEHVIRGDGAQFFRDRLTRPGDDWDLLEGFADIDAQIPELVADALFGGTETVFLPSPVGATEVAAAITTGALGLINAHFKSAGTAMSAADVLARLRDTATKTGIYADSSIYGQGLINVQAAITPQGSSGIALTRLARGAVAPLDASALVLRSPLLGDALRNAFAGQTFIALDQLHSPFRYPLNSLLRSQQPIGAHLQVSTPLERSVQRLADGGLLHVGRGSGQSLSLALQQGALGMQIASDIHPGLSFGSVAEGSDLARTAALQADSALFAPWAASDQQWHSFGAAVELGNNQRLSISRYRALGRDDTDAQLVDDNSDAQDAIALSWQANFAGARFGLQHVRSQSADELLGIEASGGLGGIADSRIDAANSWGLIELSARSRLLFSLWHLRARADNLAQGALASVNGLTADSWALALMLSGAANTDLTLRLEQPLRARSGTLHFEVPTGYTPDRHILFSALDADATPSGRELRVQVDFSVRLGERGGRLQLSAGSAHEPGHVRGAPDDHYALVGLTLPL